MRKWALSWTQLIYWTLLNPSSLSSYSSASGRWDKLQHLPGCLYNSLRAPVLAVGDAPSPDGACLSPLVFAQLSPSLSRWDLHNHTLFKSSTPPPLSQSFLLCAHASSSQCLLGHDTLHMLQPSVFCVCMPEISLRVIQNTSYLAGVYSLCTDASLIHRRQYTMKEWRQASQARRRRRSFEIRAVPG